MQVKVKTLLFAAALGAAWSGGLGPMNLAAEETGAWEKLNAASGFPGGRVSSLASFQGAIFAGSERGLCQYGPLSKTLTVYGRKDGLAQENVLSLCPGPESLWIGTEAGLAQWQAGAAAGVHPVSGTESLRVQALAIFGNGVYLAARQGLYCYRPEQGTLTGCTGWEGQDIRLLQKLDRGLVLVTAKNEVYLYFPDLGSRERIELKLNAAGSPVTGIEAGGDNIWFATDGSGVIGYNIIRQEWTAPAAVDPFISAMAVDGEYLWLKTFSGLSSYRIAAQTLSGNSGPNDESTDRNFTVLMAAAGRLWAGTQDSGVWHCRLGHPTIGVELTQRYFSAEKAVIRGWAEAPEPPALQWYYCREDKPDVRLTRHAALLRRGNSFETKIDFAGLDDGTYVFQITARTGSGQSNTASFTLIRDTRTADIAFSAKKFRAGEVEITVRYQPAGLEKITVFPGKHTAVLDRDRQICTARVTLHADDRQILFQAQDARGRTREFAFNIQVTAPPKVKVIAQQSIFIPGAEEVRFKPEYDRTGEPETWELAIVDHNQQLVRRLTGQGEVPGEIVWDGRNQNDELVPAGGVFHYALKIREAGGFTAASPLRALKSESGTEQAQPVQPEKISRPFYFDPGYAVIKDYDLGLFDEIQNLVRQNPRCLVFVEGHADNRPANLTSYPTNQLLSEARAVNVAARLAKKYEVDRRRITVVGFGDTRPVAGNRFWRDRMLNRRVDVFILKP